MMTNELISAIEAMDPTVLGNAAIAATTIILTFAFIGLIRYLMIAIGYSKMYRKAGIAPWKAFIPVYNTYNNYKLSLNAQMFAISVALYVAMNTLSRHDALALQLVAAVAGITLIAVMVKQNINMAKLFGKGTGTGIALMLFPGITSLILGLGKAEFQAEMIENT